MSLPDKICKQNGKGCSALVWFDRTKSACSSYSRMNFHATLRVGNRNPMATPVASTDGHPLVAFYDPLGGRLHSSAPIEARDIPVVAQRAVVLEWLLR